MPNADRISEIYRAEIRRDRLKRVRNGIDWLVGQSRGEVLDVDCSEGIASILCARKGLRVLGIDNAADRIEYCHRQRSAEPPAVQERLRFELADARRLDVPDDAFDTILLGEVVEHLEDPGPVLEEVARVAKPDATIAITLPFGYSPHHDHRETYFVASLLDLLASQLTVESLDVVETRFQVVATPGGMSETDRLRLLADLQPLLERLFMQSQIETRRRGAVARRRRARISRLQLRLVRERRGRLRARRRLQEARRPRWRRAAATLANGVRRPGRRSGPGPEQAPAGARERSTAASDPSTGSIVPVARPGLTAAVILDPPSSAAFGYEWRQVQFGKGDWRETLEREEPDLLFVESALRGNDEAWEVGNGEAAEDLQELVAWCGERRIPTAFWNTREAPGDELFSGTAKLFDWVFTVDPDQVPRYREVLGHDRVRLLRFAAQPRLHNPIAADGGRKLEVAEPELADSLSQDGLPAVSKGYKVLLDGSAVLDGSALAEPSGVCPRAAFELAASGTPSVFGYSPAIGEVFGDLVGMERTPEGAQAQVALLLADSEFRDRVAQRAMREVFSRHTCGDRVDAVLGALGIPAPDRMPSVSVLLPTNREHQIADAIEQVAAQAWRPLQLVIVLHGLDVDPDTVAARARAAGLEDVVVRSADRSLTLGACMNLALDAADGELLAKMDDDNLYGEHFIGDLVHALSYTDAGLVGKWAHYVHLETIGATMLRFAQAEHRYVDLVQGGTILCRGDLLRELRWDDVPRAVDSDFLSRCKAEGVRVYSADRFSFVSMRHAQDHAHSWTVGERRLMSHSRSVAYGPVEPYVHV